MAIASAMQNPRRPVAKSKQRAKKAAGSGSISTNVVSAIEAHVHQQQMLPNQEHLEPQVMIKPIKKKLKATKASAHNRRESTMISGAAPMIG